MKKITKIFTACIVSAFLAVVSLTTVFAAEIDPQLEQELTAYGSQVVEMIAAYSDEELSESANYYGEYGETVLAQGFLSMKDARSEYGEFVSAGEPVIRANDDDTYTITVPCKFEKGNVNAVIGLTSDLYGFTEFSFTAPKTGSDQSLGQLMKDASVNLIVGMGTVFAVLVFLCWVISLFKYIHTAEEKLNKKKAKTPEAPTPAVTVEKVTAGTASADEIQAVIAAAIAAYESETGSSIVKQGTLANGKNIRSYRR